MMWQIVGAVVILYLIAGGFALTCKLLESLFPSIWKTGRTDDDDNY